ncbi:g1542 [Coccomyxa viridis]|uniref:G1542 protein n=1 Tax=Coccomyxa viridis TaxID=1274662 RepID=A0ABP1FM22_9CHLO
MDGTLTKAVINFAKMRQRANILEGDILEVLGTLPVQERVRVEAIINEVEDEALPKMQINDGVIELCNLLDEARVPRALLTRNTSKAVAYFHENHFSSMPPFAPAVARDFGLLPKPDPAAILHICREWGVLPSETVMVGDSLQDDVISGNRAAASTILLDMDGTAEHHLMDGELKPAFIANSMHDVAQILQTEFVLRAH